MNFNSSPYRQRQSRQFEQACIKPGDGDKCTVPHGFGPKFEILMEYRGQKVILTDHVRKRSHERHGMPIEQMKVYFQHVIDGIDDVGFQPTSYNQEVFIYSKQFQRGMIIAFRRDFKNQKNTKLALVAITVYPYGKSLPAHPDTEVIYV